MGKKNAHLQLAEETYEAWEFPNALPVYHFGIARKYQVSLSGEQLALGFRTGHINYVGEVQRGYAINKKGESVPVFNRGEVNKLMDLMLEDSLYGGTITLNMPREEGEIEYFSEDDFKIRGGAPLQIIDGQHRIRAFDKWMDFFERGKTELSPADYYFPVVIENLSAKNAKELFVEYSTMGAKISASRIAYLKEDLYRLIANYILENSELDKDKVETVKGSKKLVSFSVLKKAITIYFKPRTKQEANEVGEYLSEFFDILINMFPYALAGTHEERKEIKKTSMVNEQITFYFYLSLASKIQSLDNWQQYLQNLNKEENFFNKTNPIWENVLLNGKIVNKENTVKAMGEIIVSNILGDQIALNE